MQSGKGCRVGGRTLYGFGLDLRVASRPSSPSITQSRCDAARRRVDSCQGGLVRYLRILIVDDHEAVRGGIRSLLSARAEWSVCGEAGDGLEAVEKAQKLRPDVVLMDITMPRMDGVQATKIIRQEVPEAEIVLISQNDPSVVGSLATEIRAHAFVSKSDLFRDLLPAIDGLCGRSDLEKTSELGGGRGTVANRGANSAFT